MTELKGFRGTDFIPVRHEPAKGATLAEMRDNISKELLNTGDLRLMWCNEGDLIELDFQSAALSAEPVVAGLEWMGRTLYYNGRQLGMVIGLNDPGDQHETEIKWDYWLGLGGECNEEFDSEEKAHAALEAAARAWLSPQPASGEKLREATKSLSEAIDAFWNDPAQNVCRGTMLERNKKAICDAQELVRQALKDTGE